MRAWRVHELGEPVDVMRLEEVDDPVAGPGQVMVDVAAAALNFPDVLLCRGEYQEKPPLPFTPGVEIAGAVSAVGEGVEGVSVGDRVLGSPVFGPGGLTEKTICPASGVFKVPGGMPMEKAAALEVTYQTGHLALYHRAQLKEGEVLLVHAGAGGVGSAAIQLGLAAGARVFATAGGPDKVKVLDELGVEIAIDYQSQDFVEIVKEATGGQGADVIYDPVGGDTFDRSTKCIAFEGRLLVIGFTSGRHPQARANHVLIKNYSVVGVHWGLYAKKQPHRPGEIHRDLMRLWDEGKIDPLISLTLPLEQAPQALAALGSRGTTGKVVVTMGNATP